MINQNTATVIKTYNPAELHKVKDNEVLSKMNYLYQVSLAIKEQSADLSNFYLKEFALNAQKRVIRVDKEISKDYCRKCLQFYEKSKFQIERQGNKVFLLKKCSICKKIRKQFLSKKESIKRENEEFLKAQGDIQSEKIQEEQEQKNKEQTSQQDKNSEV
ncbi:RNase P Rpr2/Rpp21 subunit domain protein (macronuclear) [Tetrahymena thermophila SB210]|uniref:RNase P Rpr2/Rpp21 subunit domain protein n=1 Tax=Tetrahymena thermophila (strain SB210) TaxID=312017 RepID=I7M081_TETTS|nr:RNase P Rpr2/Rpp21 subunit domain protein [Tetrahymena thermophila SB210]EAR85649.2 RNase P Rpr2/Rpp21 subunit domain protein [Tetrahymena thermophila SB210]|eukprot:XP_001033312.2 RNase P Rpr2/Rpp21 subunit domain protein [Tetrahymena thermophila SB210]